MFKKADIVQMPRFFDRYIKLADDDTDLLTALTDAADFEKLLPIATAETLGDRVYAPGKWTIRDILQHLIDTERIMAYRAMRFARNDKTALPGFEEELFGQTACANRRPLSDLYTEYGLLRQADVALFSSFSDEMIQRTGVCFEQSLSVLAIGFVLVGHVKHHLHIIHERYFPLINQ